MRARWVECARPKFHLPGEPGTLTDKELALLTVNMQVTFATVTRCLSKMCTFQLLRKSLVHATWLAPHSNSKPGAKKATGHFFRILPNCHNIHHGTIERGETLQSCHRGSTRWIIKMKKSKYSNHDEKKKRNRSVGAGSSVPTNRSRRGSTLSPALAYPPKFQFVISPVALLFVDSPPWPTVNPSLTPSASSTLETKMRRRRSLPQPSSPSLPRRRCVLFVSPQPSPRTS